MINRLVACHKPPLPLCFAFITESLMVWLFCSLQSHRKPTCHLRKFFNRCWRICTNPLSYAARVNGISNRCWLWMKHELAATHIAIEKSVPVTNIQALIRSGNQRRNGTFLSCNHAFERLFGWPKPSQLANTTTFRRRTYKSFSDKRSWSHCGQ